MDSPLVSILMPVYNAADTLPEALDSILGQQWARWTLVAVDDGSADASLEILQRYARRDARITVLEQAHRGIVAALNAAADWARTPLLARMDADDVALPGLLELEAGMLMADETLALCGCRVRMTGAAMGSGRKRYERWINSLVAHDDIMREVFVECPIPHPGLMMRRALFKRIGGYRDCPWPEDYDLVMRVWLAGGRMAKPEPVLLAWRDQAGRLSRTDERYGERAFRALKRHYLRAFGLRERQNNAPYPIALLPDHFFQWGAGEVGKKWLREWATGPQAVVDINPRKIGRRIHGVPVIAPEELPRPGVAPILVAVGAPGARDEIRTWLTTRGYREMQDFLFLA